MRGRVASRAEIAIRRNAGRIFSFGGEPARYDRDMTRNGRIFCFDASDMQELCVL